MKDIRIDTDGNQRCWNCGSKSFTQKRTFRAKALGGVSGVVTLGVAAAATPLVTKKKLKCQACDEYNDVGSAKPWTGPSNVKLAKKFGTGEVPVQSSAISRSATSASAAATPSRADELAKLAMLRESGVLDSAEFDAEKARILGA